MAKALTREDLIYILESIFRLSEQENNAFQMLTDGLYVENYKIHANNENLHVNEQLGTILSKFAISENGALLFNGNPVNVSISTKEGNGIIFETDGLFVPGVQEANEHVNNSNIHVTQEDKENWNSTLDEAKEYVLNEIKKIVIYDVQIVDALPEIPVIAATMDDTDVIPEGPEPVWPSSTTLYLLMNDPDSLEECPFTAYMFLQDNWEKLSVTNKTLSKYSLKTEVQDACDKAHEHANKEALDRFSIDDNGDLLYDGTNIHEVDLSTDRDNAAQMIDGKLYVKDFSNEIKTLQIAAAFSKVNLYDKEISDSGVYELKDSIDNYSLILVEYYYRPDDETQSPGCAKTAVIDTDVLNYLYSKNMDYMLDYGYGVLMSNSKIRMYDNKLWVDYYHNVCIYQITGIRRGDANE